MRYSITLCHYRFHNTGNLHVTFHGKQVVYLKLGILPFSGARYRKIPFKSFSEPVCFRIKCFDGKVLMQCLFA